MNSLVLESIYKVANEKPNRVALCTDILKVSYKELYQSVQKFSIQLAPYKHHSIAIEMENSPEWIIADLTCIAAGVVTVPIPPFFSKIQKENALKDAGVQAIITDGLKVIPIQNKPVLFPKGTAKITYTSGTTSEPKGVCLSQAGMEKVATSLLSVIGKSSAKHTLALLPMAVLLENLAGCYTTLLAGGCYDIPTQSTLGIASGVMPNFTQIIGYLVQKQVTSCIAVPELLRGIMAALIHRGAELPNMRFMAVGGSKVSPKLLEQARLLQLPVYQGYGLSECASVVAVNTAYDFQIDSVGQLLPHIELEVADDGEIHIHHPAFLGYLGQDAAPEYYATGDLGKLDAKGFLHITGRKKNVLITSYGRNISPEWIESELLTQPEVAQCVVVGDASAHLAALIVPSSARLKESQLTQAIARTNQLLPEYARVRNWKIVTPFTAQDGTLTGTGRPRRDAIHSCYKETIEVMLEEDIYEKIL